MFRLVCILFVVTTLIPGGCNHTLLDQWYTRLKIICNSKQPYGLRIFEFIKDVCEYLKLGNCSTLAADLIKQTNCSHQSNCSL